MVQAVYYDTLKRAQVLSDSEFRILLVNWPELFEVSKEFFANLKKKNSIADSVLESIPAFKAFVTFGKGQQSALDLLEQKEKQSAEFRIAYGKCCLNPEAKCLPLSYCKNFKISTDSKMK